MSTAIALKVSVRQLTGRKVKQLRQQGIVPANVFGHGIQSKSIQVEKELFKKVYHEVGETGLIDLTIEGETKTRPVLVSQIQEDPITEFITHIDFRQVNLAEKITANVPVETEGESPAVKEFGGVFMLNLDEIEVEALPQDLPDRFVINLGNLKEIGDTITIADLKTTAKVEIQLEDEVVVASIQAAQAEEPEATEEAPTEAETTVQGSGEEAPVEGTEAKSEE